jgi:ATP-dependent DNA helicase DinG
MICDTRLVTKGYGRAFIQSLPPMRRTREVDEVTDFLRERLSPGIAESPITRG